MSERLPHTPELEKKSDAELQVKQAELLKNLQEKAAETRHEYAENLDDIRKSAEKEAKVAEEAKQTFEINKDDKDDQTFHVNNELKSVAYRRTMKRTRDKLPVYLRPLSAFIHNPSIEKISDISARTVARPSGILAGGIVAFIGSSIFLWVARHYGYEYNFLLFALLFIAGFFVGLCIEASLRLLRRK